MSTNWTDQDERADEYERSLDAERPVERVVMPDDVPDELKGSVLLEPPFCARCGGTCECEDYYDDEPYESEYCECDLQYGEEELASNRCACCGGYIEA